MTNKENYHFLIHPNFHCSSFIFPLHFKYQNILTRRVIMKYVLTVFDKSGEKLVDETFEATTEKEAKEIGETRLKELNYLQTTHRCTSSTGKLILFHR